jgi:hypothetical protein
VSPNDPVNPFAGMAISTDEARVLRKQLEMLAEGAKDQRIKDLARDVLAGRTDLRAALLGGRYEDVLNDAMSSFSAWYRDLSDDEKAEQEHRARDHFEDLRCAETTTRRPSRPAAEDEWEPPTSILRKDPPRR